MFAAADCRHDREPERHDAEHAMHRARSGPEVAGADPFGEDARLLRRIHALAGDRAERHRHEARVDRALERKHREQRRRARNDDRAGSARALRAVVPCAEHARAAPRERRKRNDDEQR
jgi:hypothetical protein